MKPAVAAFLLLSALVSNTTPASAADEPEAVYSRFHQALLEGNLAEMKRNGSAAGAAEFDRMPAVQSKAILEFMRNMMPKTYSIAGKEIAPKGDTATLRATAQASDIPGGGTGTVRGTIRMLKESGEWRVQQASWGGDQTLGAPVAATKSQAATPAPAKKTQAAAPPRKAPAAGSADATPERRLGSAKMPCVYKPVMTNEDMEACR